MAIESTGLPPTSTAISGETSHGTLSGKKPASSASGPSGSANHSEIAVKGDSVTLTQNAKNLSMIQADIKLQPDIDSNRVSQLKTEIENGQYEFNPHRVAEKFLQFELQL